MRLMLEIKILLIMVGTLSEATRENCSDLPSTLGGLQMSFHKQSRNFSIWKKGEKCHAFSSCNPSRLRLKILVKLVFKKARSPPNRSGSYMYAYSGIKINQKITPTKYSTWKCLCSINSPWLALWVRPVTNTPFWNHDFCTHSSSPKANPSMP